jgi:hypothetical protein
VQLLRMAASSKSPGLTMSSPMNGAMQGQGEIDFDGVYRADRPAGDNLGMSGGSG